MQLLYQVLSSGEHNAILCQYPGTGSQEPSVDNSLGSVYRVRYTLLGAQLLSEHTLFSSSHAESEHGAVWPCFRAQKWEPGPCLHTVFVSLESTTF